MTAPAKRYAAAAPISNATLTGCIRLNQYRRSGDHTPGRRPAESRQKTFRPARLRAARLMRCSLFTDGPGIARQAVQDPGPTRRPSDDAVAGTDSLSAAHKAQHIKPARSKDEMLGVSGLKLPAFFRPSSWLGASSLSYFPAIRSLR
jgi:hypothetical protein